MIDDLGYRLQESGGGHFLLHVRGLRQLLALLVSDFGFWVPKFGFRVWSCELRVPGFEFWI